MNVSALKLLQHVDRLAEWVSVGETIPINVQICPYDSACNHSCPLCVAGHRGFTGSVMERNVYEGLVRDLAFMGVRSITLTGGSEPTLHPEFDDLLCAPGLVPMQQALISNGSRMDERRAHLLVERTEWVRISLDAATPALFRKIHGCGAAEFASVVDNLRLLVETKRKMAADFPGRRLAALGAGFLTYPSESSIEEIVPAAMLCLNLGLDYIQYRPILKTPSGPEVPWSALTRHEDVYGAIARARQLETGKFKVAYSAEKYDRTIAGSFEPYRECHFVHFAPAVSASGNVSLCCHHLEDDEYIIGNINERPFREIWFSETKRSKVKQPPLGGCPLLCRGAGSNELLAAVKADAAVHGNFI
jgi:MoaA/NifB/PqqE/SkfB family radical SAM enzyme